MWSARHQRPSASTLSLPALRSINLLLRHLSDLSRSPLTPLQTSRPPNAFMIDEIEGDEKLDRDLAKYLPLWQESLSKGKLLWEGALSATHPATVLISLSTQSFADETSSPPVYLPLPLSPDSEGKVLMICAPSRRGRARLLDVIRHLTDARPYSH